MTCRNPWRWSRPPAAVLLALLAGAFAPAPAHAGCGTPRGTWHGPDEMPAQSAQLPAGEPAAPAKPTPCHGPGCSQGPSQPLTIPAAPPRAPEQGSACVIPRPPFAGPESSPHRRDDTLRLPPPHPSDVYHPPR